MVYQVDCVTGMVENVIPTYAGGYGVGQMLPSAYSYYNLPMQYRSMYYPTADYSYWYAPGAIYQYDTRSSLITSVAALTTPGFSVGRPLPMGYDMYNVPMAYRATYYDTPERLVPLQQRLYLPGRPVDDVGHVGRRVTAGLAGLDLKQR